LQIALPEFLHYKLSDLDWDILEGLEEVLSVSQQPRSHDRHSLYRQVPHAFQQNTSSELMPVLSHAIVNLKMVMTDWKGLGKRHDFLKLWMKISVTWATKYYVQMDDTDAYVLAMCKIICWPLTALISSFALQSSIPPSASPGSRMNGTWNISTKPRKLSFGI